jgi:hypothetical protein
VAALELVPHHLPRAQRVAALPYRIEQLGERRPHPDRREAAAAERALHGVVGIEQAPVLRGVGGREARDLLHRALDVEPHGQPLAVREHDVRDRIGLQVLEPCSLSSPSSSRASSGLA